MISTWLAWDAAAAEPCRRYHSSVAASPSAGGTLVFEMGPEPNLDLWR